MLSSMLKLGLVTAMFLQLVTATDHTVGSPDGSWDLATDLQTWALSTKFFAGDTLTFQYPASHNVLEVSKTDFESCTTSNPLTADASGNTVVLLKAAGKRYFICGMAGHCSFGMKMEVNVNPTNPPPSSPKVFSPSPPPPSFTTPSKPPPSTSSNPPPSVPKPPSFKAPKTPSFSTPSNPPPSFKAPKTPSFSTPSNPPPFLKAPKTPSFSAPSSPTPSFKVPKHPSFSVPKSPSPKGSASPPPSSSAPSKSPYSSSMAPPPSTSPVAATSLPTTTSSSTKRASHQPIMVIGIVVAYIAIHALQF